MSGSRRGLWLGAAGIAVVVLVVAAVVFQPWKLFTSTTVVEADPFAGTPAPSTAAPEASSRPSPPSSTAPTSTSTTVVPGPSSGAPAPAPSSTSPPTSAPAGASPATRSGTFTSLEHTTTGTAKVGVTPDGRPVVFLENLDTSNGPDLKVYLSPQTQGEVAGGVNLGDLKGNKGNQTYSVPPGTDLAKYQSVVIWCQRFSVGFGVAKLSPA